MRFSALPIAGAWRVDVERHRDDRGSFARAWCADEFAQHGVEPMTQASLSENARAGTLRGLHFAKPPAREGKLVRCVRGRVHDVIVDLRADSPTFCEHVVIVLSEDEANAVYVPPGVAHGFQTLVDDSAVLYMMNEKYRPSLASGVRYDDAAFGIEWPLPVARISDADRAYPDFARASSGLRT